MGALIMATDELGQPTLILTCDRCHAEVARVWQDPAGGYVVELPPARPAPVLHRVHRDDEGQVSLDPVTAPKWDRETHRVEQWTDAVGWLLTCQRGGHGQIFMPAAELAQMINWPGRKRRMNVRFPPTAERSGPPAF